MSDERTDLSLVADIGGTNTRAALARGGTVLTDSVRRYRNSEHASLTSVLADFLAAEGRPACAGACVAVAGPVDRERGRGTLTNLDWTIDEDTLARATGAARTAVINDLEAQGYALDSIPAARIRGVLAATRPQPGTTRLVIGVGTGFNAAAVFATSRGRFVAPSEAGHANVPIRTEADLRLLRFVEGAHGFPAVEDLQSGRGLERIHAWLCAEAGAPASLDAAGIVSRASGGDARAQEAVDVFVRLLGTVAGNLALIHLPFGGIYLVGGVVRHLAQWIDAGTFGSAFRDKGRFSGYMEQFAVSLVEDDYAALTGAAAFLTET